MSHTPGPWKEVRDCLNSTDIRAKKDALVAYVVANEDGDNLTDEDHANARLISAAPDLLEALKVAHAQIIGFLNEGDFKRDVHWDASYIVDAIKKAGG